MSALRQRFAPLDELPARLHTSVILHLHGELEARAAAVARLRRALLDGRLPSAESMEWPEPVLATSLLASLGAAGVTAFCAGQPELADEVVMSTLDAVLACELAIGSATAHFAGIALGAAVSGEGRHTLGGVCLSRGGLTASDLPRVFGPSALAEIREEAQRLAVEHAAARLVPALSPWGPRVDALRELRDLFRAATPKRGWDLSHGVLRAVAAKDVATLVTLVATLRPLREVIERLGRLRAPSGLSDETMFERIGGAVHRSIASPVARTAGAPSTAVHDVERSDDPSRMLPSEVAWLGHPLLELAWHARRAERALLSYASTAFETNVEAAARPRDEPGTESAARQAQGPVIVCLDTSGSMFGAPGQLAKATVIHLLLAAHDEGRPVHVFSFSGPGDVVEHALDLSPAGVDAMLGFVLLDFDGGTDVSEPLRRALARHDEDGWRNADILLVSDGIFDPPREIELAIERRRRTSNLRVHGLLIEGDESGAMARLCDPVHLFREWVEL